MMKIEPVAELVRDLREPCYTEPGGFECGVCTQAADAIDALTAEVERLTRGMQDTEEMRGATIRDLEDYKEQLAALDQIKAGYEERLAASQARECVLRHALLYGDTKSIADATVLPMDDSALRQWGARLLDEVAEAVSEVENEHATDSTYLEGWRDAVDYAEQAVRRKADELEGGK